MRGNGNGMGPHYLDPFTKIHNENGWSTHQKLLNGLKYITSLAV